MSRTSGLFRGLQDLRDFAYGTVGFRIVFCDFVCGFRAALLRLCAVPKDSTVLFPYCRHGKTAENGATRRDLRNDCDSRILITRCGSQLAENHDDNLSPRRLAV